LFVCVSLDRMKIKRQTQGQLNTVNQPNTIMWKPLALAAYLLTSGAVSGVQAKDYAPKDLNSGFNVQARGINKLLAKAEAVPNGRTLDGNYYAQNDRSNYSIQFQGCHHIQQWNADADDEDVRLQTKRLARFRLVPYEKCTVVSPWANAKAVKDASRFFGKTNYGEYIVDLNTFVAAYLEAKEEENGYMCTNYASTCQTQCASNDDAYEGNSYESCMSSCYSSHGCTPSDDDDANADDGAANIDIYDYAGCAQMDWGDDDGVNYYFGPSCASQGGEIRMNLFSDDTCTTLAECGTTGQVRGAKCYTRTTGVILPGTSQSIISDPCVPCTQNYVALDLLIDSTADDEKFDYESYDFGESRDVCTNLYDISGKCEKYLKNGEYNYACAYIEGIQIGISKEGYAVAVRRSLGADVVLSTMAISCAFIGMYIYTMKQSLK
jgi:hypothetical protein